MDLLQTVRKEGSRGGVNFSWDDVKTAGNRENYLGHSLMAPVGRWQKNKDLSWYAKADDADLTPEQRMEKEKEARRVEMRKVKEAEEDAMNLALGLPVPDRTNVNLQPLGESKISQKDVNKALKEALGDGDEEGASQAKALGSRGSREWKEQKSRDHRCEDRSRSRERRRRHDDGRGERRHRHRRSRSRSRDVDRESRRHRHRSRSRSRDKSRRDRSEGREHDRKHRHRERSNDRDGNRHVERREDEGRPQSRGKARKPARSRSPYERRRRRDDSR